MPIIDVHDVPDRHRYEIAVDEEPAGFVAYRESDSTRTFTHTRVDPRFEGQGLGSILVQQALDDVRSRGMSVVPLCPFTAAWIRRHPAYADLVRSDESP